MEYLGATIDMDIDLFLKKVETAIENLELLDEVGNKKTKAFAKAFNEALSSAKTVNLEDTLSKLMKAKEMLGTFREGMEKLTKYGLFDQPIFTKEDSEHIIEVVSSDTEKTIKMLEDMIEKAVEAKRIAFNKLQDDNNKIPHVSTQQDAMALAQAEKLKAQPKQNGDKSGTRRRRLRGLLQVLLRLGQGQPPHRAGRRRGGTYRRGLGCRTAVQRAHLPGGL